MRIVIATALLIVVGAGAAFLAMQNSTPVPVDLLFTRVEAIPLWEGLLASFALGALLVGLGCLWSILRLRLALGRERRRKARLEQEIHGLRTLPLEDRPQAAGGPSPRG